MKTFEGDEWKRVKEPIQAPLTRPEAQERADFLFATNQIDVDRWRLISNRLSDPLFRAYDSLFA